MVSFIIYMFLWIQYVHGCLYKRIKNKKLVVVYLLFNCGSSNLDFLLVNQIFFPITFDEISRNLITSIVKLR